MSSKAADEPMRPVPVRRRTAARLGAVQVNFQQAFTARDIRVAIADFMTHYARDLAKDMRIRKLDETHFQQLCLGMAVEQEEIDQLITDKLGEGWSLERIARADHCVLRAGVFELRHMPQVPARAVISEYAGVADAFECDVQFVNAVLDKIARTVRVSEMSS